MPGLLEGLGTFFGASMEAGAKGMRDIFLEKMKEEALAAREANLEKLRQGGAEKLADKQIAAADRNADRALKLTEGQYGAVNANAEREFKLRSAEAGYNAEERKQAAEFRKQNLEHLTRMETNAAERAKEDAKVRQATLELSKEQLSVTRQAANLAAKTDLEKTADYMGKATGVSGPAAMDKAIEYLKGNKLKEIAAEGIAKYMVANQKTSMSDPEVVAFSSAYLKLLGGPLTDKTTAGSDLRNLVAAFNAQKAAPSQSTTPLVPAASHEVGTTSQGLIKTEMGRSAMGVNTRALFGPTGQNRIDTLNRDLKMGVISKKAYDKAMIEATREQNAGL